jgi:hypothetical protein
MKNWMALLIGIFLLLPTPANAQTDVTEIDLSQTYTDETLTLNYPEDWKLVEDSVLDIIFNIPISGEGQVGEGVVMSREELVAMVSLQPGGAESALEFAQESVSDFIADADVFEAGIAVGLTINDRDAAFADVLGMLPFREVVLTVSKEAKLEVELHGVPSQFTEVMPTLFEVLNTVRLVGDETPIVEPAVVEYILADTHIRAEAWTFDHPAEWPTEEGKSFTLIVVPGLETTIGISAVTHELAADLDGWVEETLGRLEEQVGDSGERTTSELSLNEQPAMRLDFVLAEADFGYTELFLYAGNDTLVRLTVIGTPNDIAILNPVFEQIITTVAILD